MDEPMGQVIIDREAGHYRDSIRRYRIDIDGAKVCALPPGGTWSVDLPEGAHIVRARLSWTGSKPVAINVTAQTPTRLIARPAGNAFMGLFQIFGRTHYITLEPA